MDQFVTKKQAILAYRAGRNYNSPGELGNFLPVSLPPETPSELLI